MNVRRSCLLVAFVAIGVIFSLTYFLPRYLLVKALGVKTLPASVQNVQVKTNGLIFFVAPHIDAYFEVSPEDFKTIVDARPYDTNENFGGDSYREKYIRALQKDLSNIKDSAFYDLYVWRAPSEDFQCRLLAHSERTKVILSAGSYW